MSPIDDELRSTLASRADEVTLSPEFFTGVERRARRMRRNRIAASVAGSALAVAAIAVAVPAVSSSVTMETGQQATTPSEAPTLEPPTSEPPTPEPPSFDANPFGLNPADPWEYRGDDAVLGNGNLETFTREWGVQHGFDEGDVTFTPLYGELFEPSGAVTVVFLAEGPDLGPRWGVVQSSESGPEFLLDVPLLEGTTALPAALPGDEVARLMVIAAPQVGQIEYAADGVEYAPMESLAAGVAITPLEGDPQSDRIRVLNGDGDLDNPVYEGPARSPATEPSALLPAEEELADRTSSYAFDPGRPWEFRGDPAVRDELRPAAEELFNQQSRRAAVQQHIPLFAQRSDTGVAYLVTLHRVGAVSSVTATWQRGDRAPEQSENLLDGGELLLQSVVPTDLDDGSALLIGLASPQAGALVLEQAGDFQLPEGDVALPGVGLWLLQQGAPAGTVLVYEDSDGGDGRLYHSESALRP
jgi:hypothetical protein